ncbi:hypothetical protein BD311DRAFT_844622 [Dichomitus squalens]|uniref:Uncharacterized protein n=1 Tax=Dichomitus squalens TaxID=114155 RepID=A0A4Q9MZM4_9APHY|nr:hypothetical protein BD311DRAFT_844622 [Dichomitus squalens]
MSATLGYSSFFSSGLLAPHTPSAQAPRESSPSTPRASVANLPPDDTTPTAHTTTTNAVHESQVLPSISIPAADDSRPRLRRRRSSLAGSASPLTNIKSSGPIRNATASVQRSLRARSGSDASVLSTASAASAANENSNTNTGSKPTGIIGRLRSGSLGTALRPRRGLRRVAPPVPALPPPSAPLPAVPALSSSPTSPLSTIVGSPTSPASPRRPLARRAQTSDNYELTASPFTVAGSSPMCVADDEDAFAASVAALGKRALQDDMQVDYPSPVDGPVSFDWGMARN